MRDWSNVRLPSGIDAKSKNAVWAFVNRYRQFSLPHMIVTRDFISDMDSFETEVEERRWIEVQDWLEEQVGPKDIRWDARPFASLPGGYIVWAFREPKDAVNFKLRWG